ncbi:MAG TPA: hypothetical protein VGX23_33310 [Actinocrinis sp.]|nr:hypothetical protein [Actinocrinis sp.]
MNQPALRTSAQSPVHIQVINHGLVRPQTEAPVAALLKDEAAHLHRIRAALIGLERAVTEALAGKVPAESVDQVTRPVLAGLRTALHAPGRQNHPVDLDEYQPDLTEGYPDNLDRAGWAAEALRTFGLRTRQIGPHNGACVDGVEEMAGDLICDLMHLLDAVGADAEYTVDRGRRYHEDEVEEEELDEDDVLRQLIGA